MIAKTDSVDVNIQDVGAIENVTIPIRKGTIVKLVGANGSGKSTAIKALTSAVTKENVGLRPRDGRMSGKVRLPGATVSFGARISRKETGEQTVAFAIVEDGTGISKIISPGIKDEVAADKKRLEGVLDVIGAELSDEQMQAYMGSMYVDFLKSRDVKGKGFVDAVKEMKLFLEGKAREVNVSLQQCDGAIQEIGQIETAKVVEVSADELSKKIGELTLELRDAQRDRAKADEVGAIVADDGKLETHRAELQTAQAQLAATDEGVASLQRQIDSLIESKNRMTQLQIECKAEVTRLSDLIRQGEESSAKLAKLKNQIASAPTVEQIAVKESELEKLRAQHIEAIQVAGDNQKIAQKHLRFVELTKQRETLSQQHASLKAKAEGTSVLLKEALAIVPGWTVNEDLRLCVEHSRGTIPFSELSPGEGTAKVCLLACQFAECGEDEIPIVGLPQQCFEGLDGRNRILLLEAAQENGLCIVTAECDTNPETANGLRVEVMAD